jgi:hypothetical protein
VNALELKLNYKNGQRNSRFSLHPSSLSPHPQSYSGSAADQGVYDGLKVFRGDLNCLDYQNLSIPDLIQSCLDIDDEAGFRIGRDMV